MDFGPSARDYATYRKGFPRSFFDRLPLTGRVLDLGTGTGSLARGYGEGGAEVVALDLSVAMLREARGPFARVAARAEDCPFGDGAFDAVIAGQCWHWFDGPLAAREAARILRPAGTLAIAHFDYLAEPGSAAEETERLVLEENPRWTMAGSDGRYERWRPHLEGAGFTVVRSLWYDEDVAYTHEAWRGRIRCCNGFIAIPEAARRDALDRRLGRLLAERFVEPLVVRHRAFVIAGEKPA